MVFDQGLGDLFVIRVAGNIVAPSQLGSIEYGAERLGARLVVVLGHSGCGAIRAALESLGQPDEITSPNLRTILDFVRPGLESISAAGERLSPEQALVEAVRANIRASVNRIRDGSELLRRLIRDDGLLVVGAEYCLESGVVEFFDD